MTEILIKEQIKTIEKATAEALQSKEKAQKFLQDAGIIKQASLPSLASTSNKDK